MYLSHSQRCRLAPTLPDISWIAASVRWALKRVHASASNEPRLKCAARVSVWSRLCSFRAAVLRLQWYCVISFFNFVLSVFCHDDLRLPPLPPLPQRFKRSSGHVWRLLLLLLAEAWFFSCVVYLPVLEWKQDYTALLWCWCSCNSFEKKMTVF